MFNKIINIDKNLEYLKIKDLLDRFDKKMEIIIDSYFMSYKDPCKKAFESLIFTLMIVGVYDAPKGLPMARRSSFPNPIGVESISSNVRSCPVERLQKIVRLPFVGSAIANAT